MNKPIVRLDRFGCLRFTISLLDEKGVPICIESLVTQNKGTDNLQLLLYQCEIAMRKLYDGIVIVPHEALRIYEEYNE